MIKTDRKNITIPQWLELIYDQMVELNKNIKKMNNAGNQQDSKKAKVKVPNNSNGDKEIETRVLSV